MHLPRRLRSRLVVSHLVVALAVLGTVLVAVSLVGPGYFADAMGHRPGDPEGQAMDAATLAAFQDAIRTALLAALAIALVAAVVVAVALSSRIATPVTRLVGASRRIAAGHYAERVPTSGGGEVGELAETFNAMAGSLEATERRRLQLVGDVAHELRTPLATLDGYLEGLQDGVVDATPETWTLLRGETGRLNRLVDDLSELWRAEARQLPLTIGMVDVADTARGVVEQFRPAARAGRWRSRPICPTGSLRRPTATGSRRCSATTYPMRSATALTVPRSASAPAVQQALSRSRSATMVLASAPNSASTSSSASTG